MTFPCIWGCGTLLDTDPSITTVTGRRIPLSCGIPHDCRLSPYHKGINSRLKAKALAKSATQQYQTEEQKAIIEEDKLNIQTPFDPQTQIYPADLFILEGFDFRRQPIWVHNPRWHDDKGYFIGRSKCQQ